MTRQKTIGGELPLSSRFSFFFRREQSCRAAAEQAQALEIHRHRRHPLIHQRGGYAHERLGAAGEFADVDGNGDKQRGHERYVERGRRSRRKRVHRNYHSGRRLHRAGRSAFASDHPSDGNKPRRQDEIGDGATDHYERHRDHNRAAECRHRARRNAKLSRSNRQRRPSGHLGPLEP